MRKVLGTLLIAVGAVVFFLPTAGGYVADLATERYIESFEEEFPEDGGTDPLYEEALEYNERILADGQADFKDAWSYTQSPITLASYDRENFGYISIPKMGVKLRLYLGATYSNMDRGAAVLGGTSLPIGGEGTNSVIAGHRGWTLGRDYFRDIEELEEGDAVIIRNPFGKLVYRVEGIKIIDPNDYEEVKIQEGKDMVTLLTCHPYLSHGKYRYLVYCVRDTSGTETDEGTAQWQDAGTEAAMEDAVRGILGVVLMVLLIRRVISLVRNKKRRKEGKNGK